MTSLLRPTPSCDSRISAFSFGVSGATPHTLALCCTDCAQGSEAPLVRVRTMDRVRALTWLCHVGPTPECVCAVCEDVGAPIGILQDGCHLAHRTARAHGGKKEPANFAGSSGDGRVCVTYDVTGSETVSPSVLVLTEQTVARFMTGWITLLYLGLPTEKETRVMLTLFPGRSSGQRVFGLGRAAARP